MKMYFFKGYYDLFKTLFLQSPSKEIHEINTNNTILQTTSPCTNIEIQDIEDTYKHNNISKDILWRGITDEFNNVYKTLQTKTDVDKFKKHIQRQYKYTLSNVDMIQMYNTLQIDDTQFKKLITKKKCKSDSGVLVITVLTSAHPEYIDDDGSKKVAKFSCKHDCAYCPNEPAHEGNNWVAQPRSYLFSEPAVLRANDNDFDAIKQVNARLSALINMGHIADKLEIIVLGGTWSEYPRHYQDRFITELYYAVNTYNTGQKEKREMLSLENEITLNENADIHIIGLTLETRPDTITLEEIKNFRRYNCTRVQLGVQHTHNDVLKNINRGHNIECVYSAIKLLKNNCYKVDIHIMPNLPGSSYEKDKDMLNAILYDDRLQVDQYKIYPCAIVPWTKIQKWYEEGSYIPYEDILLFDLIKDFKQKVQKYKRLNRIIRDIPSHYISAGYSKHYVNLRQLLQDDMRKNNWKCKCIRCREIKGIEIDIHNVIFNVTKYNSSDGYEYHISADSNCSQDYLIGFLRLRINLNYNDVLPILYDCALIRELHVYSNLNRVGSNLQHTMQHRGIGKQLVRKAEEIAHNLGFKKIAIISGTGVRNYYRKQGYHLEETYMLKYL